MNTLEASWREQGRKLARDYHWALYQLEWRIGEWWLSAHDDWRKRAEHDPKWEGPSVHICRTAATCCKRFPASRRREYLTFSHHREVVALPAAAANALLDMAEARCLTTRQLRREAKRWQAQSRIEQVEGATVADLQELVRQGTRFGTILADPAWQFTNETSNAAAFKHYPAMSFQEICALPVPRLAADNAHLHLWVPAALLPEALDVIARWGFVYRTNFVWVKPGIGPGDYWRTRHELLLLGVRGHVTFADHTLISWYQETPRRHSEKPDQVRTMIERASPAPRLELFARKQSDGWTCWGNEVPWRGYS